MNTIEKGITTLIRSAITGERYPLPEDFVLGDTLTEVNRHSVATLVYAGAVNCGLDKNSPAMQKLFQTYVKSMMISEGQMRQIQRLFAAFDEAGIDYMPLKGCKLKSLYPKPELRAMGDADVLIRMEQYDKIKPIMEELGFAEGVESDHELVWRKKDLFLELHKRLIPSYNGDFYAYFGDGWLLAKPEFGTRYAMPAEDEFIYLFTHFAKHYRDGGIGCRHVLDLWVYLQNHPEMDSDRLQAELDKLKLGEFYGNLCRLMEVWFGDGVSDEKMDYMTGFIFASGNWGSAEVHLLSQTVKHTKNTRMDGRTQYFWSHLFPTAAGLSQSYPILKKHPWVLPGVWAVRICRKVFDPKAIARTEANLKALDQAKVDERQSLLNYVGLDSNF